MEKSPIRSDPTLIFLPIRSDPIPRLFSGGNRPLDGFLVCLVIAILLVSIKYTQNVSWETRILSACAICVMHNRTGTNLLSFLNKNN